MTNVMSIDALFQTRQQDTNQQPAKNFAHELAKSDEHGKPGTQDGTNSKSDSQPDLHELAAVAKSEPFSTPAVRYAAIVNGLQTTVTSQAQQLEDVIVAPTGITEALLGARVFGWHALAQTYLSELTAADKDSDKPGAARDLSVSIETVAPSEDVDVESAAPVSARDIAEDVYVAPDVDMLSQSSQRIGSSETASTSALESIALDTQAPGYWAERSLRLIRQRDGGVVAWLRDFRVTAGDQPMLVKAVLNEAKSKGFALNKIMLNGREVWSSLISH